MGRAHTVNLVGRRVPLNDDPHPATLQMLPGLELNPIYVIALKDRFQPRLDRRIQLRVFNRRITAVSELAVVAFAAKRTVNPDPAESSAVQFGVRACAPLVQVDTLLETFEIMQGVHGIWPVVGDQISKKPARCRARVEPTVVPAGIKIQI